MNRKNISLIGIIVGIAFVVVCAFGIIYVDCVEKEKAEEPITKEEIEEILAISEESVKNEEAFRADEEEEIPESEDISGDIIENIEDKQE